MWRVVCHGAVVGLAVLVGAGASEGADESRTFMVDPAASQVRITLGRAGLFGFLGHDHLIDAPVADGRIDARAPGLERSSLVLRFEAAALAIVPGTEPQSDVPRVEARMRGPEVLDAAQHATITFTSTSISGRADASARFRGRVRGLLELKGTAHEIDLPVEVRIEGDALVARGETRLRLRDLGIEPPTVAGVVKVDNEFGIAFTIRARSGTPADGTAAAPRGSSASGEPALPFGNH